MNTQKTKTNPETQYTQNKKVIASNKILKQKFLRPRRATFALASVYFKCRRMTQIQLAKIVGSPSPNAKNADRKIVSVHKIIHFLNVLLHPPGKAKV